MSTSMAYFPFRLHLLSVHVSSIVFSTREARLSDYRGKVYFQCVRKYSTCKKMMN